MRQSIKKAVKTVTKAVKEVVDPTPLSHAQLVAEFMSAKQAQPSNNMSADFRKNSKSLCVLAGPRSWTIEAWVQRTSKMAGVPMDWGFTAGRAFVSYLGDEEARRRVLEAMRITGPAFESAAQALAKMREKGQSVEWAYEVQWLNGKPWEAIGIDD